MASSGSETFANHGESRSREAGSLIGSNKLAAGNGGTSQSDNTHNPVVALVNP